MATTVDGKSNRKVLMLGVGAVCLAVAGWLAWTLGGGAAQPGFKLAVLVPETGNLAFVGAPIRNVLTLAQEDFKAPLQAAGVKLDMVFADTQGSAKEAVTAFNRVADVDHANGVLTSLSGPTLAVAPLAKQRSMLFMGLTIDPAFLKDQTHAFRFQYSALKEGDALAALAVKNNWKRMLILYSTDASTTHAVSQNIQPKLVGAGVAVVTESFTPGNRDFKTMCAKHAAEKWDGVVYHGFGSDLGFLIEACAAYPNISESNELCAVGCLDVPVSQRKALTKIRLFGPQFYGNPSDEIKAFYKKYESRFPNQALPWHSLYAYDAYAMLARSLIAAKSNDVNKLKAEFLRPGMLLTQSYEFTPQGDHVPPSVLLKFDSDGKAGIAP